MISPLLPLIMAIITLAGLSTLETRAWLEHHPETRQPRLWLAWLTAGLLTLGLIWSGIERGHVPPVGFDELLAALALLVLAIYLKMRQQLVGPNVYLSLGITLTTILMILSIVLPWPATPYPGQVPLWLWALLVRWVVLTGVAGLYWLTLLSALGWLVEKTGRASLRRILQINASAVVEVRRRLRPRVLLWTLSGSILALLRSWWGWGLDVEQFLGLLPLILLLLAAWWLRFTWPQRRLWTYLLTILAFIAAWPALMAIAT